MASAAQIAANRANAQSSTGPRTLEGKAAVARNRTTHGLSSRDFFLLPGEDLEDFQALLDAYLQEHQPEGPTESFLVNELAHCQWKLRRVSAVEAGLLGAHEADSSPVERINADLAGPGLLLKLGRYEARIRRDWYRALSELRALRRDTARAVAAEARYQQAQSDAEFNRLLQAIDKPISLRTASPPPVPPQPPAADREPVAGAHSPICNSKPIAAADPVEPPRGAPVRCDSQPHATLLTYTGCGAAKPPYR
jgi:hypothetical protein